MRAVFAVLLLWTLWSASAFAQPASLLASIFQDHAVLQRGQTLRVWGAAEPNARVSVLFDGATYQARADRRGDWMATLPAHPAGGPYTLTATAGARTQTLSDVMVGDVFLCSGQSNMQMMVSEIGIDALAEIRGSANPNIRLVQVARYADTAPLTAFHDPVAWQLAGPDSVAGFSAACFYMGRDLQRAEHVPIGLINASWGGSLIEAWISAEGFHRIGGYDAPLSWLTQYRTDHAGAQSRFTEAAVQWWDAHDPGTMAGWATENFDDSSWPTMQQPGPWEDSGDPALANFDGSVWFRTSVSLTAEQAARHAQLSLGLVDDYDHTFINGVRVGGFRGKSRDRLYDVPTGLLHAGRNTIALGVIDTGTGGGLISPADQRALRFDDGTSVQLPAPWRYHISLDLNELGRGPLEPWAGGLVVNFNGMVAPIAPYNLAGVAWYQGESNVDGSEAYARLLPGLMTDWRAQFRNPNLPFLIVQLPNYGPVQGGAPRSNWSALREVQRRTVNADAHAGLVVTIDIGNAMNVHPTNKIEVGRRLALEARRVIYGEAVVADGPTPRSVTRNGQSIVIAFDHADGGLVITGADAPIGFLLCDAARQCRYAAATADGATVRLETHAGDAFVRYCWGDNPLCNLYSRTSLPAVPFELAVP